ncbi:MAG: hypothetical protein KJ060_00845 [Candidatus Hydrogenedentes bacterium]|nr:hypothetical protein [Candidatus Hydrogenedentota bacterium]
MTVFKVWASWALAICAALAWGVSNAHAQTYPPLTVEIGPYHPLFLFQAPGSASGDTEAYAQQIASAWATLPNDLRPYSVMAVNVSGPDAETRHLRYTNLLKFLQSSEIPVAIQIADENPRNVYPLAQAEELIAQFTAIKGIQVSNLAFDDYSTFGGGDDVGLPANVRWLSSATDLAARYGRFIAIRLDGTGWLHVLANAQCRPLLNTFRNCSGYVVPLAGHGAGATIAQQGALMGLWLEGAVAQWGVAPDSAWYANAGLLEPGVFGAASDGKGMPPSLYRAMVLNGTMGGACVYAFPEARDLWAGERVRYWAEAIKPVASQIIQGGLVADKEFVAKKATVAYQMVVSRTPQEFQLNLRDLDGIRDEGLMLKGAYGMERPGQIVELIPNSGRHYWVPIMSPYAPPEVMGALNRVVKPASMPSAQSWTELLDQHLGPDGSGSAFIVRVGRGVFVMHTRESHYEEQSFMIPSLPAPVRGITAKRNESTVTLEWPFREGDVSYTVFKRTYPTGEFAEVAKNIDERSWTDPAADPAQAVAYAVTALTNEKEPYEGTVNFGDYLAFSFVESRIDEEIVLTDLVALSQSRPLEGPMEILPKTQDWWPSYDGVSDEQRATAEAIAARIEQWNEAFAAENLDGVMDLYGTEYRDPQWWQFQYVKRAYQWFFERYGACKMTRQLRQWDFTEFEAKGEVRVLLYCRFSGTAISDPTGRFAGQTAWFPRTETGEIWLTFANREGEWRIERSDPALPNFADILSFSAGPYDSFPPGPDIYGR